VPWGFRKVLQHVYKEYAKPSGIRIYVTENGFTITGETKMTTAERVNDVQRQTYFNGYIKQLINAVREDGMPVAGYMGWSLLDNLEW
jgi:beta-glucosidase